MFMYRGYVRVALLLLCSMMVNEGGISKLH